MKWIAYAVLAASLALNAYLLAHRLAAVTAQPPSRAEHEQVQKAAERAPAPPEIIRDATATRAELEQRLAEAEHRIDELKSPDDRWKDGKPTPEAEAKVRPYLDKVFAKYGAYKLDCRGGACRIDSDLPMSQWMEDLQRLYPDRALFQQSFANGHAYIELAEPSLGAGMWLWWAITLKASDAMEACLKATSARGDLGVDLDLDDASRRVSVRLSGSLAAEPVGMCVRRAFEDASAATSVPPEAHAVMGQPIHFELPAPGGSSN